MHWSILKVMLSEKYKPNVHEYAQSNEIYDAPTEKEIKLNEADQKMRDEMKKDMKRKREDMAKAIDMLHEYAANDI